MNKTFINTFIKHLQNAGLVTKAAPWMVEGFGKREMNVRYVGIKLEEDWADSIPSENNMLLKFVFDKQSAYLEFYIANYPPFFKFFSTRLTGSEKWETVFGELKRRLKKDREEVKNHNERAGNLYVLIQKYLK